MKITFHRPAVIGAGTMGIGIIEVLVTSGYHVRLVDISTENMEQGLNRFRKRLYSQVEKGRFTAEMLELLLSRVEPVYQLEDLAEVDLVIEAIAEDLDVKHQVFKKLDLITQTNAILATNTSSLSITSIASVTRNPERVIGLHFFNPAPRMPLVEVIQGLRTDPLVIESLVDWVRQIGKEPVKVMDSPGFLVNRIARPFHLEAYQLVGNGFVTKKQLDRIVREAGFKMGPFELQDLIGIDINLAATVTVYNDFFHEPRFRPHPQQKRLVESGALGLKTGKGHYENGE